MFCFFFSSRRRHTRCGRDWSSDVCSSDLKGPGVRSLRVQSDKIEYSKAMRDAVLNEPGVEIVQKMVKEIVVENGICVGIKTMDDEIIFAKTVVITSGTYMSSKIMVSDRFKSEGPDGDPTTNT